MKKISDPKYSLVFLLPYDSKMNINWLCCGQNKTFVDVILCSGIQ